MEPEVSHHERLRRKLNAIMDTGGCRRLHLIATHRAVDEGPDVTTVETGFFQSRAGCLDADCSGQNSGIEETPFTNSRHEFEPPRWQRQSFVNRSQTLLNFLRCHHMRRQTVGDGFDADVFISHIGSCLTLASAFSWMKNLGGFSVETQMGAS